MENEHPADSADVAEFNAMMVSKSQHRMLRTAVVVLKVIAVLYAVIAVVAAYSDYGKLMTDHQERLLQYWRLGASNPYLTAPSKPSGAAFFLPLFREGLIAFFIFVGGELIKLHLGTRDELNRVAGKLGL